jgi:DNA-directed RNA polymerase specialized sigma24 family protein
MTLTELHTEHGDYLLRCLRLYGVPEQDCEDARQDIYLHLLDQYVEIANTNVRGFCSHLARNEAVNWKRKHDRMPRADQCVCIDADGFSGEVPEMDQLACKRWDEVADNPNVERIAAALELAKQYQCDPEITAYDLLADLLYGLTIAQIAEKHGVNPDTIKRWVREWRRWVAVELPKPGRPGGPID